VLTVRKAEESKPGEKKGEKGSGRAEEARKGSDPERAKGKAGQELLKNPDLLPGEFSIW
jgi:hypothetical protein